MLQKEFEQLGQRLLYVTRDLLVYCLSCPVCIGRPDCIGLSVMCTGKMTYIGVRWGPITQSDPIGPNWTDRVRLGN